MAPLVVVEDVDDASEASTDEDDDVATEDAGGDVVVTSVQFIVMAYHKEQDVTFGVVHLRITKVSTPAPIPHFSLEATPHPSGLEKEQAG